MTDTEHTSGLDPADHPAYSTAFADIPEIYITTEQAHRLAAIACDTLAGMQIGSTLDQNSTLYVHTVDYDQREKHYTIEPDGSYKDVT